MVILKMLSWLYAFSLIFTVSPAYAGDCQSVYDFAYSLQLNAQKGIYTDFEPKNRLEIDMKNNVWQRPKYKSVEWKIMEAERFAEDWYLACKNNLY